MSKSADQKYYTEWKGDVRELVSRTECAENLYQDLLNLDRALETTDARCDSIEVVKKGSSEIEHYNEFYGFLEDNRDHSDLSDIGKVSVSYHGGGAVHFSYDSSVLGRGSYSLEVNGGELAEHIEDKLDRELSTRKTLLGAL